MVISGVAGTGMPELLATLWGSIAEARHQRAA